MVTTHEATRAGFIAIAFEKNIKATPFVEQAKALKNISGKVKSPSQLLDLKDIYPALLTASGLSEKSLNHLNEEDKKEAIKVLIEKFLEPAGTEFVDELYYRFLLTRGDTLGGMMRNIAGSLGEKRFIRSLISILSIRKSDFKYLHSKSKAWIEGTYEDLTIDENAKGLYWKNGKKHRTLIFNVTPQIVSKNVDACLFNSSHENIEKSLKVGKDYICLGELKGGIDPAGADEHWKTANTALERIRTAFVKKKFNPNTFFIGAAIEKSMAQEIYNQLKSKQLSNAANLTDEKQLNSICYWICNL